MRIIIATTLLSVATLAQPDPLLNVEGGLTAGFGGQGGLLGNVLGSQGGLPGGVLGSQGQNVGLLQGLLGGDGLVGGLVSGLLGPVLGGVIGGGGVGSLLGGGVGAVGGAAGNLVTCLLSQLLEQVGGLLDQVLAPLLGPFRGLPIQVLPPLIAATTEPPVQCRVGGTTYNEGDSSGCFECTADGYTFIGDNSTFVSDVSELSEVSCCPITAGDSCVVLDCHSDLMARCEAEARCVAQGLALASVSFYENRDNIENLRSIGPSDEPLHANIREGEDGEYYWMPEMIEAPDLEYLVQRGSSDDCSGLYFSAKGSFLVPCRCSERFARCSFCYDPKTSLPPCQ